MAFQCIVLTPEQQLLDQQVLQVILPAHDGLMGILTDRSPIIVKLGIGPLRVDLPDGTKQHYFVEGGVGQMKENVLTILTTGAVPASEIDHEAAVQEYSAALAKRAIQEPEVVERDKALQRARVKQRMSRGV
jgi:F-type H+-transporting ATPase subunit epsilon